MTRRPISARAAFWWIMGISFALAFVGIGASVIGIAEGQTAPSSFCGYAHTRTTSADIVDQGAGYASQSVGNQTASAAPTRPVLKPGTGAIVGAIVEVQQTSIRFRTDGITVSGTFDGRTAAAGSLWQVCGSEVDRWSAIASSTGSNSILWWNWQTTGG